MKKTLVSLIIAVTIVSAFSLLCAQNVKKGKVLLIAREGKSDADLDLMLNNEVGVMTNLLRQAGFEVSVASPSGQPIVGKTKTLKPDLKLSNVNMADYAGVLIPCLARLTELPADFVPALKGVIARGKPVAAQAGGVYALSKARLLVGKKYAFSQAPDKAAKAAPELKDTIYSGTGVVTDGNIITSGVCSMIAKRTGLPDGSSLLAQTLIAALIKK